MAGFAVGYRTPDYDDDFDGFDEDGDAYATRADLRSVSHYCNSCGGAKDISVHNPWGIHSDATPEQIERSIELMKNLEAEGLAESAAESEHLSKAVAAGDMHAFNRAMPTTPKRNDVMARAFSGWATNEKSEKGVALSAALGGGDDETISPSEVFDNLASTNSPDTTTDGRGFGSGETAQRSKVLEYLNSPQSRSQFRPNAREALRLWAEGSSQKEVERRTGTNQGNFSKLKKRALTLAYSGR